MRAGVPGNNSHKPQPDSRERLPGSKKHKRLAPRMSDSDPDRAHNEPANIATSRKEVNPKNEEQQPEPSKYPTFEFINTTNNVQYSGPGSRSVARSHVMRNFHRQKGNPRKVQSNIHSATTSAYPLSTPHPQRIEFSISDSSETLRLGSNTDFLGFSHNPNQEVPTSDRSDVDAIGELEEVQDSSSNLSAMRLSNILRHNFPILPMSNLWALPIDSHACELIYHHVQVFAKTFVPMSLNSESEWFKYALNDPACYHGTLSVSAAHKALLTGNEKSLPLETYQHKGEAVRIINERLNDLTMVLDDGTIAAIACLAAFETLSGTSYEAGLHIDGLEKLVGMRGGPRELGMNGFLEQFLYWVDLSNATAERKKPHFVPFEPPAPYSDLAEQEALWKHCETQWDDNFLGAQFRKTYQGLDLIENGLFHRLRQITALLSTDPSMPTGPHQQQYTAAVLNFERQVGAAVQERITLKKKFGGQTFSQPTCLFYIPALIYCYMILRPTPIHSSIYDLFVARMKDRLVELTPTQLWGRLPLEFWFWSLMIVGAASMGRPEQPYMVMMTSKLCGFLKLQSWESAKVILRDFAWADSICEHLVKEFWDQLDSEV